MAITHLGGSSRQEVVNFPVDVYGALQVLDAADLGLDKMVTVNGGRNSSSVHACGHELENGHLNEWEDDVKTFSRERWKTENILERWHPGTQLAVLSGRVVVNETLKRLVKRARGGIRTSGRSLR